MSGVTIDELADRARIRRQVLAEILEDELRDGRVRRDDDGRYTIVCERFARETLEAFRDLQPFEAEDDSRFANGHRRVKLVTGAFRPHERDAIDRPLRNGDSP
jgi:hypothetical protein